MKEPSRLKSPCRTSSSLLWRRAWLTICLVCALGWTTAWGQDQNLAQIDNVSSLKTLAREAHVAGDMERLKAVIRRIQEVEPDSPTISHYNRLVKIAEEAEANEDAPPVERRAPERQAPYFTPIPTPPLQQDFSGYKRASSTSTGGGLPIQTIAMVLGAVLAALLLMVAVAKLLGRKKNVAEMPIRSDEESDAISMGSVRMETDSAPQAASAQLSASDFDSMPEMDAPIAAPVARANEPEESAHEDDSMPVSFDFDSSGSSAASEMEAESYQATPTVSDIEGDQGEISNVEYESLELPGDEEDSVSSTSSDDSEETVITSPLPGEMEEDDIVSFDLDQDGEQGEYDEIGPLSDVDTLISQEPGEAFDEEDEEDDDLTPVYLFEDKEDAVQSENQDDLPPVPAREISGLGGDRRSHEPSDDEPLSTFDLNDAETLLDIQDSDTESEPKPQPPLTVSKMKANDPFRGLDDADTVPDFPVGEDLFGEANETLISEPLPELPPLDDDDLVLLDEDLDENASK